VARDWGAWSSWTDSADIIRTLPGSHTGETLNVEVRAVDGVGNVGATASGTAVATTNCDATADGVLPVCTDDTDEGIPGDEEDPPDLTPSLAPATPGQVSPLATPANVYVVHPKYNGQYGEWATIRSRQQSYVLGLAHDGWRINVTGSRAVNKATYFVGLVQGDYDHCGWISGANLDPTDDQDESNCTTSFASRDEGFSVGVNCVTSCNGGTPITFRDVGRGIPECAVVLPTPTEAEPTQCRRLVRTVPLSSVRNDYHVSWRYVTKGRNFVMVRDLHYHNQEGAGCLFHVGPSVDSARRPLANATRTTPTHEHFPGARTRVPRSVGMRWSQPAGDADERAPRGCGERKRRVG
jgi:hypothetical protein